MDCVWRDKTKGFDLRGSENATAAPEEATKSPEDLFQHRLQRLVAYRNEHAITIIPRNVAKQLRDELGVTSDQEWRRLVTRSKYICDSGKRDLIQAPHRQMVRELIQKTNTSNPARIVDILMQNEEFTGMPRMVIYEMVQNCLSAQTRKSRPHSLRKAIKEHVLASPRKDVPTLCAELEQKLNVSRNVLYDLVTVAQYAALKNDRQVKQARQQVVEHMQQSEHWNDIPRICDELESGGLSHIPRGVLRQIVVTQYFKMARQSLPRVHRGKVREYVAKHADMDTEVLCRKLHHEFAHIGVPQHAWHPIVTKMRDIQRISNARHAVTPEQREQIRQHIEQSSHPHDHLALYKELQSKLNLPHAALYNLVKRHVVKGERREAHSIRARVQDLVQNTAPPYDESGMYEQLKEQIGEEVSPEVLQSLLRAGISSAEKRMPSFKSFHNLVRLHVEQSPHPENILKLVDEIREKHGSMDISPKTLYDLVLNASLRVFRKRITKDHKNEVRRLLVEESPDKDTKQFTIVVQSSLLRGFPKTIVHRLVQQQVAKMRKETVQHE